MSARLGDHWRKLLSNTHDSMSLQLDWNKYGQTSFKFVCLTVGPQWADTNKRFEAEQHIIKNNIIRVYNMDPELRKINTNTRKKPVKKDNILFESVAAAARITGESETQIHRQARNPNNSMWCFVYPAEMLGNFPNMEKARAVIVHGVYYKSIRAASQATNIDRRTLTRHLNSNNKTYCHYVDLKESI